MSEFKLTSLAMQIKNFFGPGYKEAIDECEMRCKLREFDDKLFTVTYTFSDKSKIINYLDAEEYRAYDR